MWTSSGSSPCSSQSASTARMMHGKCTSCGSGEVRESHWCEMKISGHLDEKWDASSHESQQRNNPPSRASSYATSEPERRNDESRITHSGNLSAVASLIALRTRRRWQRRSRAAAASASFRVRWARRAHTHMLTTRRTPATKPPDRSRSGPSSGTQIPACLRYQMPSQPHVRSAISTSPSGQTASTAISAHPTERFSPGGPCRRRPAAAPQPQGSSSSSSFSVNLPVKPSNWRLYRGTAYVPSDT
mmetsp:Transcript_11609/g.38282  ORF Transcript_11609/g.38282 Transcript_11609/m.38282 type:complete len:245 (+) Transcript_11609:1179-1913(+)